MTATLTFWGTRGSIPCPDPHFMEYGGHTSCISVDLGDTLLILDAGSGLQKLGRSDLIRNHKTLHILLSHAHLDHIMGLPFFKPLYDPNYTIHFYAGHLEGGVTLDTLLRKMLTPPFSPVTPETFRATLHFHDFHAGETIAVGNQRVLTYLLNHPGGSTGYRITSKTGSVSYITDTEHRVGHIDDGLVRFIEHSDVFVYDSMFCDETFTPYIGWGHSTWQQGVRLMQKGNIKKFLLFHHSPESSDDDLNTLQSQLEMRYGDTVQLAKEGKFVYV